MALYSIAFSMSHIFGHNSGMHLISEYGYVITWDVMMVLAVLACALLVYLLYLLKKEATPPLKL